MFDIMAQDLTNESGVLGKVRTEWIVYDQIDMWFSLKDMKKSLQLREPFGLEEVSLIIKKGRSRLSGHMKPVLRSQVQDLGS